MQEPRHRFRLSHGLLFALLLTLGSYLSGCATTPTPSADPSPPPAPSARETFITIVDRDGETTRLNLYTLAMLSQEGALMRSTGTIEGPAWLSGPTLETVLAPWGGLARGQALRITATDGYSMIFTYEQSLGNIMTYDSDGKALVVGDTTPILALESMGPDLTKGLPRLAFVGANAPLTDGHFWIRDIAELALVKDVSEWELHLYGLTEYVMDRSTFESLATCPNTPHPAQRWETTDKEGNVLVYDGVPLWVLISTVDGAEELAAHYRFNRSLAREGYTVQVISQDGYTVEFSSQEIMYNDDVFLAYLVNGEILDEHHGPLFLTGPYLTTGAQRARQVREIRLVNLPE